MTQQRLKELLDYNPETGIFIWKIRKGRIRAGTRAGYLKSNGYEAIMLDWKMYFSHRLAWLFIHGELPDCLDHINGIRSENQISNLRKATRQENGFNQRLSSSNTSGFKGVYWSKVSQKWAARVGCGKDEHIGVFVEKQDAIDAVRRRREELHREFTNHG